MSTSLFVTLYVVASLPTFRWAFTQAWRDFREDEPGEGFFFALLWGAFVASWWPVAVGGLFINWFVRTVISDGWRGLGDAVAVVSRAERLKYLEAQNDILEQQVVAAYHTERATRGACTCLRREAAARGGPLPPHAEGCPASDDGPRG